MAETCTFILACEACSETVSEEDLIRYEGDVITEHQFFEEVKNNPTAYQILLQYDRQKCLNNNMGQR